MYDVVVIGAGIVGSWAAYHMAKGNHSTLLLDQFNLPHTRGSSHGQTRISRTVDVNPLVQRLSQNSLNHWRQLERDSGEELMVKSGMLSIDKASSENVRMWKANAEKFGSLFEEIPAKILREKYHLNYSSDYTAFYEPDSVIFKAQKALMAHSTLSLKGRFEARKVIVCTGPWSTSFLSDLNLPLKPVRSAHIYWKKKASEIYSLAQGFPSLSHFPHMYCVPEFEYPGMVKIVYYAVNGEDVSPEKRDWTSAGKLLQQLKVYIAEHFPGIDSTNPAVTESCMITYTPDGLPIIGPSRLDPNVLLAVGFSGWGYKVSAEAGRILRCLVENKESDLPYDVEKISVERFKSKSSL